MLKSDLLAAVTMVKRKHIFSWLRIQKVGCTYQKGITRIYPTSKMYMELKKKMKLKLTLKDNL